MNQEEGPVECFHLTLNEKWYRSSLLFRLVETSIGHPVKQWRKGQDVSLIQSPREAIGKARDS
jgi:hypothetical protein